MALRIGVLMDPIATINTKKDTTLGLLRAASAAGHQLTYLEQADLTVRNGETMASLRPLTVYDDDTAWYAMGERYDASLSTLDVVLMRKDPPFDIAYVFSTYMLDLVSRGTLVLNDPASIRDANEKMVALRYPDLVPTTLVTADIDRAMAWAADVPGKVVLKPWDGNGGRGVLVTQHGDGNMRSMLELLTDEGRTHILLQHYIPEIREGDKRIILIDGEARGWMNRVPGEGDHRGNMHVGATVQATELSDRDREICDAIGPWLKESGLLFVGIDTIGQFMTEINVTSPTGIQEINRLMGTRLESDITDAIERKLSALRRGDAT